MGDGLHCFTNNPDREHEKLIANPVTPKALRRKTGKCGLAHKGRPTNQRQEATN